MARGGRQLRRQGSMFALAAELQGLTPTRRVWPCFTTAKTSGVRPACANSRARRLGGWSSGSSNWGCQAWRRRPPQAPASSLGGVRRKWRRAARAMPRSRASHCGALLCGSSSWGGNPVAKWAVGVPTQWRETSFAKNIAPPRKPVRCTFGPAAAACSNVTRRLYRSINSTYPDGSRYPQNRRSLPAGTCILIAHSWREPCGPTTKRCWPLPALLS